MNSVIEHFIEKGYFFLSDDHARKLQDLGAEVRLLKFDCDGDASLYEVQLPGGYSKVVEPVTQDSLYTVAIMTTEGERVVICSFDESKNVADSKWWL